MRNGNAKCECDESLRPTIAAAGAASRGQNTPAVVGSYNSRETAICTGVNEGDLGL